MAAVVLLPVAESVPPLGGVAHREDAVEILEHIFLYAVSLTARADVGILKAEEVLLVALVDLLGHLSFLDIGEAGGAFQDGNHGRNR